MNRSKMAYILTLNQRRPNRHPTPIQSQPLTLTFVQELQVIAGHTDGRSLACLASKFSVRERC